MEKFLTLPVNKILAVDLGDFFKNLRIKGVNVSKNTAKYVLKDPRQSLENGANVGTAIASRSRKDSSINNKRGDQLLSHSQKIVPLKLYPFAQLEKNIDLEQRLEKKLNDVNTFNNSNNFSKEKTSYFSDRNYKSKQNYKEFKTMTTIINNN